MRVNPLTVRGRHLSDESESALVCFLGDHFFLVSLPIDMKGKHFGLCCWTVVLVIPTMLSAFPLARVLYPPPATILRMFASGTTPTSTNDNSATNVTAIPWTSCTTCWRPTIDDVERISYGQPARRKGTGSRGVPHRLNADERKHWDRARVQGCLQVVGSGWRSQRREAPLLNSYRSLCDARGQAMLVVHKGSTGLDDVLLVDLSPLRSPETFLGTAAACVQWLPGGTILDQQGGGDEGTQTNKHAKASRQWMERPIYQLPPYSIYWELSRSGAKSRAKELASVFSTVERKGAGSRKPRGLKPGKNRRHGGYGIG